MTTKMLFVGGPLDGQKIELMNRCNTYHPDRADSKYIIFMLPHKGTKVPIMLWEFHHPDQLTSKFLTHVYRGLEQP